MHCCLEWLFLKGFFNNNFLNLFFIFLHIFCTAFHPSLHKFSPQIVNKNPLILIDMYFKSIFHLSWLGFQLIFLAKIGRFNYDIVFLIIGELWLIWPLTLGTEAFLSRFGPDLRVIFLEFPPEKSWFFTFFLEFLACVIQMF